MKFSYFHLMPWCGLEGPGPDWPVANHGFDPERGTELYKTYIDTMAYAEECGFDWVGCNEHHFSPYGLMTNCNLIGAVLSQRTSRINIAMCGNLVPLLNPVRVAEEYAMLDVMSGGRLIAGLMRGIPHEYVAYNVSADESWGRLAEGYDLIVKAWTEREPFAWHGKYYNFPSVSIWPRPRQQPHPPILISASSPESARFAAERRAIMGIVMVANLEAAKESIRIYRETARKAGWEPTPDHILVGAHTLVAETAEDAKRWLDQGTRYLYETLMGGPRTAQQRVIKETAYYQDQKMAGRLAANRDVLKTSNIDQRIERGLVLCGTPDMVVDQAQRIHRELGHGIMHINMKIGNIPDDVVHRSMTLWAHEVMPHLRAL
jgi:alkanesulfonate monooxygenase SsuD/methylene tetrahydromethanopterin reductase-like flavin-dependent oxidoreductase (luciferase family)